MWAVSWQCILSRCMLWLFSICFLEIIYFSFPFHKRNTFFKPHELASKSVRSVESRFLQRRRWSDTDLFHSLRLFMVGNVCIVEFT